MDGTLDQFEEFREVLDNWDLFHEAMKKLRETYPPKISKVLIFLEKFSRELSTIEQLQFYKFLQNLFWTEPLNTPPALEE